MRKILFIGAPGSGKGTQARLLKKYGLSHINIGESIRTAVESKNSIVLPYKKKMESGELLPDRAVFSIIWQEIKKADSRGYIIDGFARNVHQAKLALEKGFFDEVVFFDVPEKKAVSRVLHRAKIGREKRSDDNPETIKKRFAVFKKETLPVLDFLKKSRIKFYTIDASKTISLINEEVVKKLRLK